MHRCGIMPPDLMSGIWFLAGRCYSLCIWIKNTLTFVILVADVICILSKNSQFFEIKIRPSKLHIWFLILFLKIEKFLHWESVKWTRLTFSKRAVISADLFFLVQCSLFLEVFQHVLCQSTNLNYTNSTDAKAKCADYSPRNISSFVNLTTSGYHSWWINPPHYSHSWIKLAAFAL